MRTPVISESEVTKLCRRHLMTRPDIRLWRANGGAVKTDHGYTKFGVDGQADFTGVITICGVGVRLEVEMKSSTGKQSPDQARYERMIADAGGIYVLARSVESLVDGLVRGVAGVMARKGGVA